MRSGSLTKTDERSMCNERAVDLKLMSNKERLKSNYCDCFEFLKG